MQSIWQETEVQNNLHHVRLLEVVHIVTVLIINILIALLVSWHDAWTDIGKFTLIAKVR